MLRQGVKIRIASCWHREILFVPVSLSYSTMYLVNYPATMRSHTTPFHNFIPRQKGQGRIYSLIPSFKELNNYDFEFPNGAKEFPR
ncbi:hypothetical protein NSTC745_01204 [Nostoc sp. DSM 114161]|jgi:hypothetical protein